MQVKLATLEDTLILAPLMEANSKRMQRQPHTDLVLHKVLSDIKHGFVIIAVDGNIAVGFMMFTYEWSDWRDGVFLWLQAAESSSDQVFRDMRSFLNTFAKTQMKY
jgi:hypothetical protein